MVIYVTPYFQEWAVGELRAILDLPSVRAAVVSQDSEDRLPDDLRSRIAGHWRIDDTQRGDQVVWAARELRQRFGPVTHIISGQEHTQIAAAEARWALGLPGMSVDVIRRFRDKAQMKDRLRAAGIPCAKHALARDERDVWQFGREIGYPLVAKPYAGAGTVNTFLIERDEDLWHALSVLQPGSGQPLQLEEFIEGTEHSFETFSLNGHHLWHSLTHYLPSPLEVMRHPWIQMRGLLPREIDDPGYDDIRAVAYRTLDVLGMDTGVSHIEWFRRPDGSIAISEAAARSPGGELMTFMSRANDFHSVREWARLLVLGEFEPPAERRYAVACAYIRAQGDGERIVAIRGIAEMFEDVGELITDFRLPGIGAAPSRHYSGDGFVILRHPETGVALDAITRVVDRVRIDAGW